ncbi:hypothetical protein HRbin03_00007 [archaeon HR03]|uniref:Branched-chain amino acid ABC transporter, permease n=2 Tax=Thermoproteati TaxID=1783275 RepID=E6NAN0_CALS0|nr:branched-chain amino acid ABC transporter, permease [Candidatus Caldarchaeum subterraneum]GBC72183.1 hypothetical protein HRbin03_00007 [archaeon HR03]
MTAGVLSVREALRTYSANLMGAIALAAVLGVLPFFADDSLVHVLGMTFLFVLLAVSWDLIVGYTGVVNLGLTTFVGLGGYASALLIERQRLAGSELSFLTEFPPLPIHATIPVAGLVAAFLGLLVGLLTLRLKGWYFALVTAILPLVFMQTTYVWKEVFGGEEGFVVKVGLGATAIERYYAALAVLLLTLAGVLVLTRSRIGLRWKALREDEVAAEALGVSTMRYKLLAFVVSSFIAGVVGAMIVHYRMIANNDLYDISLLLLVILAVVVGGQGTIWGPVVGGFLVYTVKNWWLKPLVFGYLWPMGIPLNDDILLYSILIVFAVARPHGLWEIIVKGSGAAFLTRTLPRISPHPRGTTLPKATRATTRESKGPREADPT